MREAKQRSEEEWSVSIAENFKGSKIQFWKRVSEVKKGRIGGLLL